MNILIDWLTNWFLTPTWAIIQLYRDTRMNIYDIIIIIIIIIITYSMTQSI